MRRGQDAGLCVAELVESSQAQARPMGTHMDQLFSGCRGWPMEWASGTLDVPTLFWRWKRAQLQGCRLCCATSPQDLGIVLGLLYSPLLLFLGAEANKWVMTLLEMRCNKEYNLLGYAGAVAGERTYTTAGGSNAALAQRQLESSAARRWWWGQRRHGLQEDVVAEWSQKGLGVLIYEPVCLDNSPLLTTGNLHLGSWYLRLTWDSLYLICWN